MAFIAQGDCEVLARQRLAMQTSKNSLRNFFFLTEARVGFWQNGFFAVFFLLGGGLFFTYSWSFFAYRELFCLQFVDVFIRHTFPL